MRFRGWLYGLFMKKCGKDFQVTHDAILKDIQNMYIGKHCFVGNHAVIMGRGKIKIDDEVMIAPHVIIISSNHGSYNGSYRYGHGEIGTIILGKGCWDAGNSTIQKDSILPVNSVLSANSFLNKQFETSNAIYGGVPAKLIKKF